MAQPFRRPWPIQMSPDELKRVVKCIVCMKVPRQGNIFQCSQCGHCNCSKCHSSVTHCPTCNYAMIINPYLEKRLPEIRHGCKFSDQGCNFEDTPTPLGCHEEKDCNYRLINCTILTCKTQVSLAKLMDHLEIMHMREEVLRQTEPSNHLITYVPRAHFQRSPFWGPHHIKIKDNHFFVHCWRRSRSDAGGMSTSMMIPKPPGRWHIWVNMLASQQKCEEYIFTAKISGQGTMWKEEVSLTGPCIPPDYSKEKVAEYKTCLIFTDAHAKRLLANGHIKIDVRIESVNVEFPYSPPEEPVESPPLLVRP